MAFFLSIALVLTLSGGVLVFIEVRRRWMQIWLGAYIRQELKIRKKGRTGKLRINFCMVDHFEPREAGWGTTRMSEERARVEKWCKAYPAMAREHRDSVGRHPQHTFFFPAEDYFPDHLDNLGKICREGFGDVEIHLHHDQDNAASLKEKLSSFATTLRERHGLLRTDPDTGKIRYGFIHGNWALDNSGAGGKWCGVNNELQVLRETGCYADFTLPSAPSETQTRKINSIYYAKDDPRAPKSHNDGTDVKRGGGDAGDLMIVQGPLTLDWGRRKWGILPRIESGEVAYHNPPNRERIGLWIRQAICIVGAEDEIFIKVFTHGAQGKNIRALLDERGLDHLYTELEDICRVKGYVLRYFTAYEMFKRIRAIEEG